MTADGIFAELQMQTKFKKRYLALNRRFMARSCATILDHVANTTTDSYPRVNQSGRLQCVGQCGPLSKLDRLESRRVNPQCQVAFQSNQRDTDRPTH